MPSKRTQQEMYNAAILQQFRTVILNLPHGIRFQVKIKFLQSLVTNWNFGLHNISMT